MIIQQEGQPMPSRKFAIGRGDLLSHPAVLVCVSNAGIRPIYDANGTSKVQTIWPLDFNLDKSAVSERETVEIKNSLLKKKHTRLNK